MFQKSSQKLWLSLYGLACCLCVSSGLGRAVAETPRPPNVVFIMADDLGWADVGFHGGRAATPHLDRLAKHGLELAQHYVAPVCSPTRTGLLTGRCWSRFGVVNPQNEQALPMGTVTLASALRSVGYATCIIGKWHLGSLPAWGPNHFGFDHSYGSMAGGVSPWNHFYKQGPYTKTWHRNETLLEETGHVTDLITREAVEWLKARDERPFFLYVPYTAVHLPVKEPAEWVAKVPAGIVGDVPRHYAASVMHLDDGVGQILRTLEELGQHEQTIVVFTSDNGGSTAENNDLKYPDDLCPNGRLPGDNRPWRGEKGSLYEGGTRVPTVIWWPGKIDAGSAPQGQLETPLQIIDWMPTFCELAGYTPSTDLKWDGVSLASHLLKQQPLTERALYAVAPSWRGRSVRWQHWKLIVSGEAAKPRYELYNLADDPSEQRDLSESDPQRLASLLEKLDQLQAADRDAMVSKTSR